MHNMFLGLNNENEANVFYLYWSWNKLWHFFKDHWCGYWWCKERERLSPKWVKMDLQIWQNRKNKIISPCLPMWENQTEAVKKGIPKKQSSSYKEEANKVIPLGSVGLWLRGVGYLLISSSTQCPRVHGYRLFLECTCQDLYWLILQNLVRPSLLCCISCHAFWWMIWILINL